MGGASRYRPPPSGAVAEVMARDPEAEGGPPFGGYAGELATLVPFEPGQSPPAAAPFRIPPPDWEADAAERVTELDEQETPP